MASDDIWILGIAMTKFGKHSDKDIVDLGSEAAIAALADAGVTMADIGILAAGNLMGAGAGFGQQLQKQIGQTGIPVFNVANACATGATALRTAIMAVKAGEARMGLAVGAEKLSGAGLLGGGGASKKSGNKFEPSGRFGSVMATDGRIGTDNMPGTFAQVGMEYGHKYGGVSFENLISFRRTLDTHQAEKDARCPPNTLQRRKGETMHSPVQGSRCTQNPILLSLKQPRGVKRPSHEDQRF